MLDYEAYIKLDNDIKHRPATFQGTTAEWEALSAAEKSYYIDGVVNLSDDNTNPEVVDQTPTQNSTHLVTSGGVWNGLNTVNNNLGTVELSSVAAYAHAVGTYFIWIGQFVKVTSAIAIGDTIKTGVNVASTSVSTILSEINNSIYSHGLNLFNVYHITLNPGDSYEIPGSDYYERTYLIMTTRHAAQYRTLYFATGCNWANTGQKGLIFPLYTSDNSFITVSVKQNQQSTSFRVVIDHSSTAPYDVYLNIIRIS